MSYKGITLDSRSRKEKDFDIPERKDVLWNLQLRW